MTVKFCKMQLLFLARKLITITRNPTTVNMWLEYNKTYFKFIDTQFIDSQQGAENL